MADVYPTCLVVLDVLMEDWGAGTADSYQISAVPLEVEVLRNDHRTPDTATVTLDLRDFPFDARAFRSCRVKVMLGDVGAPDGALTEDDGQFIGFVDTPKVTRSEDGDRVVLECRDYTGSFLDHRWTGGAVALDVPLHQLVEAIVAEVPGTDALISDGPIGYSEGARDIVLADLFGRTRYCPPPKDDAWTVLCDLLSRVGLIPVFVVDYLYVLQPKDFGVDRLTSQTSFTPVSCTLAYGRDVRTLGYIRRFKEARTMQVEVRAYDERTRKTTTAKYPAAPIVTKKRISTKGKVTEDTAPIMPWSVSGTYTAAALSELAQRIYDEAARQEIEVTAETSELRDIDGVSLPTVGNGARLTIDITANITTDIAGLSTAEAIARLTTGSRALPLDVATAFVASVQAANYLAVQFYVKEARHKWSRDDGYSLSMTAINYVGGPV